ncbi:MAG: adenylate/guanylate cyclase domain-containing protein, partial [Pseudomonadota bacterium]
MAEVSVRRKLAAVLHADVKSYSRLMGDNEEETLHTLNAYRRIISQYIEDYRGRVVDMAGDSVLAEFASAVNSVKCSIAIQLDLAKRNAELLDHRKMEFRIGVNLGDVLEDGNNIYGDGVNIAARVEALADGGGICVSGSVHDLIGEKLDYAFDYLGEHQVKNIVKPIRIYRLLFLPGARARGDVKTGKTSKGGRKNAALVLSVVLITALAAAGIWLYWSQTEKMAKPQPTGQSTSGHSSVAAPVLPAVEKTASEKPSIAVLPFDNMSNDPEQDPFVDGMSEDLMTDLSKISGLLVIARNSVFVYKGKATNIQQIGRELGARYILEGSVRKLGTRIRINAQLIDAQTGGHLWAERYDEELKDIFNLQDKINQKICLALALQLTDSEKRELGRKGTTNPDAYGAFLKGLGYSRRWTKEDVQKAIFFFKRAIELDPDYGSAYAALGYIYFKLPYGVVNIGFHEARAMAFQYMKMAMKNPDGLAYALSANLNLYQRLYEEAISDIEHALLLNPNVPELQGIMANILIYAGRPKDAIQFAEFQLKQDPNQAHLALYNLGLAGFCLGEYNQAISYFEKSLAQYPDFIDNLLPLAVVYAKVGRDKDAFATLVGIYQKTGLSFPLRDIMYNYPFKDVKIADSFADGLLKAGVKTGDPPGYYKVYEENKLSGGDINNLVKGVDKSLWWTENDRLCFEKWRMITGCYPVFRNPEGRAGNNDEYLVVSSSGYIPFSSLPVLKKEPAESQFLSWTSDEDGKGEGGVFIRKNPPTLSIKYPADYRTLALRPIQVFWAASEGGLPNISVNIIKHSGDVKEALENNAEKLKS